MKRLPYQVMVDRWLAQRDAKRASRTKLGMEGYAYLCAMLREQPSTARGLQHRARLGHVAAYRFMMTMHAMEEVHICAWQVMPKAPVLPIFKLGAGADVDPPTVRPNGRPVTSVNVPDKRLCAGVMAFVQVKRAMETPASRTEMTEATGLHYDTLNTALDALVSLDLAHVAMWVDKTNGGAPLAHFEWGPGPNAPKRQPSKAQRRELLAWRSQSTRPFAGLLAAMASAGRVAA